VLAVFCLVLLVACVDDDRATGPSDRTSGDDLPCPRGAAPALRVDVASDTPARDDSLPIDRLSKLNEGGYGDRALGATVSHFALSRQVSGVATPSLGAGFCAYATRVAVTLTLSHRVVHVAREFRDESCIRDEVLAHEQRHVRLDDSLLAEERARLADALPAALAAMPPAWGDTRPAAEATLTHDVAAILAQAEARFLLRRRLAHAEQIDTPAERRHTQEMCGGRVPRLLATLPRP
jgi:hypothetical protein